MRERTLACLILISVFVHVGCRHAPPQRTVATESQVKVLTYNINWGGMGANAAVDIIRQSGADIVCLQETTPEWENFLRAALRREYPFAEFRSSAGRMGGGLAFLARTRGAPVAYVPSDTGWFDGWILKFDTRLGPVQVLNVHLRPPVSDRGSFVSGYWNTRDDRERELKRFYAHRETGTPMVVAGDFNDGENSRSVRWLEGQGFSNALPEFDKRTPTWNWRLAGVTLRRRMDHVLYSQELTCTSAKVTVAGESDHFPVEATLISISAVR